MLRRRFIGELLSFCTIGSFFAASHAAPAKGDAMTVKTSEKLNPQRTLVIWYSRRGENYAHGSTEILSVGHTERLAKHAAVIIRCSDFEIRTVKNYPENYRETTQLAQIEIERGIRPKLREPLPDLSAVDVVLLGHPIWWNRLPPAVTAFLESVDLSGKTILHFCTHEGSRFGITKQELKALQPKARIIDGPAIQGTQAAHRLADMDRWLEEVARSL